METLLSVAFDNLASYDGPKVKKGLRQVEGLLAQICLSAHAANRNKANNNGRRSRSASPTSPDQKQQPVQPPPTSPKQQQKPSFPLSDLSGDAAFREFFKLQDGFQWNIATRLIQTLDRLLAKSDDGSMDLLMLSALDSLQGVLLLHPASRLLFSREQSMNLLLDLLEPVNCPAIQAATLLVLVVALLETPRNTRTFENLDGLLTVSSIFKSRSTARDVKFKTMEFLYFYLMPETPSLPRAGSDGLLQRSPSKLGRAFDNGRKRTGSDEDMGAPGEDQTLDQLVKQEMLRRHLPNVDELVKDLQQYAPFGGAVA
ncbi:hypothetical protein KVR01_011732 [Diaporthe batatas]|uniref:uncharacterized protein n=1 Tax=Diaporthe batatas TaxID=748121 RepID=UPI001D05389D|nr:uncharacterized protein KVR01_011732 [Diaporthe batatas]KAG8158610.1 hypothetical protein KVR01_011732 [Diaporthe batatas]